MNGGRVMGEDGLIPEEEVLDDMYSDMGMVSWAARDYYYTHYATPEQREQMDQEDRVSAWVALAIMFGVLSMLVYCVINMVFNGG